MTINLLDPKGGRSSPLTEKGGTVNPPYAEKGGTVIPPNPRKGGTVIPPQTFTSTSVLKSTSKEQQHQPPLLSLLAELEDTPDLWKTRRTITMTNPDPRAREIAARNARALAEATHAPPPDIAADPAAYLDWARSKPAAFPKPPRRREFLDRAPKRDRRPEPTPDPEYDQAAAKLARLPDLGEAALAAARQQLGPHATRQALVIHAANTTPRRNR